MARVQPFRAVRFASLERAGQRLLPNAGRVPDKERKALALSDPHHVARLYESPDPWAALLRWKQEGAVVEEEPALYLAELESSSGPFCRPPARFLLGAMNAAEALPEFEEVRHRCRTAPIEPVPILAADDQHVLRDLFCEASSGHSPVWESEVDGQLARLWRLGSNPLSRRIRGALEELPIRPHGVLPEKGELLAAVVPLSDPGLQILPYHRGVRGLETFSAERFLTLMAHYARISDLEQPLTSISALTRAQQTLATVASGHHAVVLVLPDGTGKLLRFRQALELTHLPAVPKSPTLRSLDLSLLNALVFRTVLGIRDPSAPDHPNVFAVPTFEDLVRQVLDGVFQAGFALNPPPNWEVRAVMEARQVVPPRTLRLSPLPPAGLLFLDPEARG